MVFQYFEKTGQFLYHGTNKHCAVLFVSEIRDDYYRVARYRLITKDYESSATGTVARPRVCLFNARNRLLLKQL